MSSLLRKQRDDERKQRTREVLLDAAQQTFIEQGYHKTLVSDVVAKAGVGQGTFYRHFEDKSAVFIALFERLVTALLKMFGPMSSQLPRNLEEYQDASRSAVRHMAAFVDEHRDATMMLLREAPSISAEIEGRLHSVEDQFARLAEHYLDHAIASGFARPCRSDIISQAVVGMGLRMATLLGRDAERRLQAEALADEIVTFAFLGLGWIVPAEAH